MKLILLIFVLILIFDVLQGFSIERSAKTDIYASNKEYFPSNDHPINKKCDEIIALLDGSWGESQIDAIKSLKEEIEILYNNVISKFFTGRRNWILAYHNFQDTIDKKEEEFYKRKPQEEIEKEKLFEQFILTLKEDSNVIVELLNNFQIDVAELYTQLLGSFVEKIKQFSSAETSNKRKQLLNDILENYKVIFKKAVKYYKLNKKIYDEEQKAAKILADAKAEQEKKEMEIKLQAEQELAIAQSKIAQVNSNEPEAAEKSKSTNSQTHITRRNSRTQSEDQPQNQPIKQIEKEHEEVELVDDHPDYPSTNEEKKEDFENTETIIKKSTDLHERGSTERLNEKMEKDKALKKAIETAISASIPPEFCWRGNNPICPENYPSRSGLLCYRNCEAVHQEDIAKIKVKKPAKAKDMGRYHYYLYGGVCWESCSKYDDGRAPEKKEIYKSFALVFCKSTKHSYHLHWKRSFITSSVTNFDSGARCPDGKKKSWFLGLCYRKCTDFGYVSCGAGACALDGKMCLKHILKIIGKTILGVAEVVLFGLTLGGSSAIKEALHFIHTLSEVGAKVVEKLMFNLVDVGVKLLDKYTTLNKVFKNEKIKADILIDCKTKTAILLKNFPEFTQHTINEKCESEIEELTTQSAYKVGILTKFKQAVESAKTAVQKAQVLASYAQDVADLFLLNGILDAVTTCKEMDKKVRSDNQMAECIKKSLEFVASIDPTGIVGLIATFVYPTCRSANPLLNPGLL